MNKKTLIGPFSQIVTMDKLPHAGPLSDNSLEIIKNGGILTNGQWIDQILSKDEFEQYRIHQTKDSSTPHYIEITEDSVLIPGLIDSHTHICYAGSRADDYAQRLSGVSYLEIAKRGGGILSTVNNTRAASQTQLADLLQERAKNHLLRGVTTCEVKSGYGLNKDSELAMLSAINAIAKKGNNTFAYAPFLPDLIPTCLSAHFKPEEFEKHEEYLAYVIDEILPEVKSQQLSKRVDIFIEKEAFNPKISLDFLTKAKKMGFSITVHADQFTSGGSKVAAQVGAISADHLEASKSDDLQILKSNNVIATVLPGASIGLGVDFAPARKILDAGLTMVISSDWNPGSAPMGELLMQASILGVYQKLTVTETLASITQRAAQALGLSDRGVLKTDSLADMIAFSCKDFKEIIYNQGALQPSIIWKRGRMIRK